MIFPNFLRFYVLSRLATREETRKLQFIIINRVSFHLWWKENLLNHQKVFSTPWVGIGPSFDWHVLLTWLVGWLGWLRFGWMKLCSSDEHHNTTQLQIYICNHMHSCLLCIPNPVKHLSWSFIRKKSTNECNF